MSKLKPLKPCPFCGKEAEGNQLFDGTEKRGNKRNVNFQTIQLNENDIYANDGEGMENTIQECLDFCGTRKFIINSQRKMMILCSGEIWEDIKFGDWILKKSDGDLLVISGEKMANFEELMKDNNNE